jgi:hypothetical protein
MAEEVRNYDELREFVKKSQEADTSLRGTFKTYLADREKYNRMKNDIHKQQGAKSSSSSVKYR